MLDRCGITEKYTPQAIPGKVLHNVLRRVWIFSVGMKGGRCVQ